MTDDDVADLVEWSTGKVVAWAQGSDQVRNQVRLMEGKGTPDHLIQAWLVEQIESDEFLMGNVFEPITGVGFDDINWESVIDKVAGRKPVTADV